MCFLAMTKKVPCLNAHEGVEVAGVPAVFRERYPERPCGERLLDEGRGLSSLGEAREILTEHFRTHLYLLMRQLSGSEVFAVQLQLLR